MLSKKKIYIYIYTDIHFLYRFPTPPEVRTHHNITNSWEPEPSGHSSVPRLAAHGFELWVKLLGLSHHVAPGEVSGSCLALFTLEFPSQTSVNGCASLKPMVLWPWLCSTQQEPQLPRWSKSIITSCTSHELDKRMIFIFIYIYTYDICI